MKRDAGERIGRKNSREPVVLKAGSALEPLASTGDLSTARIPPSGCIERVIASTHCGDVGSCLPSRYGPTLTKIACSCLSKGATASDVLPAGVRVRRTRLRTESGMLMLVPITVMSSVLSAVPITVVKQRVRQPVPAGGVKNNVTVCATLLLRTSNGGIM